MKSLLALMLIPLSLLLAGCLSNPTNMESATMHAREAQVAVRVDRGVVLTVDEVMVQTEGTEGATILGSILGAGLGSLVGEGSGSSWGAGIGAVLGGAAGEKASRYHQKAFAYIVELQNRKTLQIVQQGALIAPNTAVFVKYLGGGRTVLQVDTSQGKSYQRTDDTRYTD